MWKPGNSNEIFVPLKRDEIIAPTVFQTIEPTIEQRLAELEKTVALHEKALGMKKNDRTK